MQEQHSRREGKPIFVGHRGYPALFPENTLQGCNALLASGLRHLEIDLQCLNCGTMIVLHDDSTARTSNDTYNIADLDIAKVQSLSVHEPERFGDKYLPSPVSTLEDFCKGLIALPEKIFIEIKEESLDRFTEEELVAFTLKQSAALGQRRVIISFNAEIIRAGLAKNEVAVGWVLKRFDREHLEKLKSLHPSYAIINENKIDEDVWENEGLADYSFDWMFYDFMELNKASYWFERGVKYLESRDAPRLSEELAEKTAGNASK